MYSGAVLICSGSVLDHIFLRLYIVNLIFMLQGTCMSLIIRYWRSIHTTTITYLHYGCVSFKVMLLLKNLHVLEQLLYQGQLLQSCIFLNKLSLFSSTTKSYNIMWKYFIVHWTASKHVYNGRNSIKFFNQNIKAGYSTLNANCIKL